MKFVLASTSSPDFVELWLLYADLVDQLQLFGDLLTDLLFYVGISQGKMVQHFVRTTCYMYMFVVEAI